MCVRYVSVDQRAERFLMSRPILVRGPLPITAEDLFPGKTGPILRLEESGQAVLVEAQWGLQPPWAKSPLFGQKNCYNAVSEEIERKPSFRTAWQKARRCILPVTAYFEQSNQRWLRITATHDDLFSVAGLYQPPSDASLVETYTMLTCLPNPRTAEFHDRMPVILSPDDVEAWLTAETSPSEARPLMTPCPDEWLAIEDVGSTLRKRAVQEALF